MKQEICRVTRNSQIARGIYLMTLRGDTSSVTAPGQFINIRVDGFYLRRPISICDWNENEITVIYRVVGGGTAALAKLENGSPVDILCGLGNGFCTERVPAGAVLVGGGIGVPPMYALAKRLAAENKSPSVIIGFKTGSEVFYEAQFRALGIPVQVATEDGSVGGKGFVTDCISENSAAYICACGPEPMLKAVYERCGDGQFSFEARMACGFGACMGCSCKTKYGYKRICRDGPVLERGEIIW